MAAPASQATLPVTWCRPTPTAAISTPITATVSSARTVFAAGSVLSRMYSRQPLSAVRASARVCRTARISESPSATKAKASVPYTRPKLVSLRELTSSSTPWPTEKTAPARKIITAAVLRCPGRAASSRELEDVQGAGGDARLLRGVRGAARDRGGALPAVRVPRCRRRDRAHRLPPERALGTRRCLHRRDLGADAARAGRRGYDRRPLRAAPVLRRDRRDGRATRGRGARARPARDRLRRRVRRGAGGGPD